MKKRILGILLALVMVLSLLPATAGAANVLHSGTCGDNATYVITDDDVMTVSGTGTMTAPMPSNQERDKWKPHVRTLIIEEGITGIGESAFSYYDYLNHVKLPESLTEIGAAAFNSDSVLLDVSFGSQLRSVGTNAFGGCWMLKSIDLPDSLTEIGAGAFRSCYALKELVVPGSVKTISNYAFSGCKGLRSVVLMDGVETLGYNVFYECQMITEFYLPDTIRSIGIACFCGCNSLETIRIPVLVDKIPQSCFERCGALASVIVPGAVKSIDLGAFNECSNLRSVYYAGTEAMLRAIQIQEGDNEPLYNADFYLLPAMPDPVFYLFDMPARDNWAYPGIAFCLYNGLMNGVGNGYFQPNGYTTRAQLVTILWRLMGEPKPESPAPFTDLTQDWYRDAVAWAAENNITNGTSATTFAPDEYVTREQMVTIFYRMCRDYLGFDMSPSASLDKFPDNGKVSDWAVDAMQWGIAVKLINGAADGSGNVYLVPQGNAIRSQVATVMLNFVTAFEEYFVDEDTTDASPQAPAVLPTEGLVSRKGI